MATSTFSCEDGMEEDGVSEGEGKNLGPCSGPNRQRDLCTFCTISLDQEEVFRTKVFDKSLSPFYGEDFYFEIPRPFQCLSFYVFAKGVFQRDLPVGKVSIRKEELCKFSGKEHWFGLQPVDPNSEVQGKVHLEMRLNELIIENGSMCQQLLVRIIECQGLPLISGQNCDPYATVSLVGPARSDQKKTKVKKKTSDPQFEETFNFEDSRCPDSIKLSTGISIFNPGHKLSEMCNPTHHCQIQMCRLAITLNADWVCFVGCLSLVHRYLLQPKGNGKSKTDDLGSLRLNVTYTEDNVLPSACYTPLRTLLLKSPDIKPISASAAHILGDICRERYEAVLPVVRLLLHHSRLVPFVSAITVLELENTQEANTIFRGNSLATRCIDDMMKIVGRSYLTVTLKPVLDEICDSNKTCEIDPIKLKEGDNVEVNKENLQGYVQKVFSSITQSSSSCPPLMCDVFRSLRHMASKRFPGERGITRIFVLSPHLHPTSSSAGLQSSGNLSKSSFKESYMYDFFKSFQEDKCIEKVKKVIKLTVPISRDYLFCFREIQKRAQGRKRIGKRNFKKRWLRVTNRELSYHKHRGKEALCIIPVKNIRAVEKLYESAFNRKNMFQVLHSEKPLYVQAGNCVEASEWVEVLSQVSRCNPDRLGTFHPSAHVAGAWLCCRSLSDNQPGCKPCTPTLLANLQLDIDCDRETERIFSLLTSSYSKLQKMEDACASIAVYQGPPREQDDYSLFTIQDPKETFHTVQQITHILEELQREHDTRSGTAQYGSQ
uniref:RAS p21 protein activator 2 n=1 Tax=Oncorhynchus mykiss TaxID=8022 RepID=A0A8C7U745_ONCMY